MENPRKKASKYFPFGACTKVEPCNRLSNTEVSPCSDSEHSLLNRTSLPKIQGHVSQLEAQRDHWERESLIYQQIQREIVELNIKLREFGSDQR
jgi:hypothetical protein